MPESVASPITPVVSNCEASNGADVTTLLKEMQSCEADLSRISRDLIRLFLQLQEFKHDPEFHQIGFGVCCRFNSWLREADSLRDGAGHDSLRELGIVPGNLSLLGLEYMRSAGRPTEHTKRLEASLMFHAKKTMGLEKSWPTPTVDSSLGTEVVGEWMYKGGYFEMDGPIVIFSKGGQLRLEQRFADGSKLEESIVEIQASAGRRFNSNNEFGEYFIINSEGDLEVWNTFGLITTAKKLQ